MDILEALVKLRNDLKKWVTNNILALKDLMPTKVSELINDTDFVNKEYAKLKHSESIPNSRVKYILYYEKNIFWRIHEKRIKY